MVLARCPFCTHTNPRGARFCNECGSPLHLRPCEHCEAVNDVLSRQCYRCNAPLRPERALTPIGVTSEGNMAPALEATTVIAAYGNEAAARRSPAPWLDAHLDDARVSPSLDDDLPEAPRARREPRLGDLSVAQIETRDGDAAGARPARYVAALVGILVIAGLAALGSYTFVQRGVAQLESAQRSVPASAAEPSTAAPPSDLSNSSPSAAPEAAAPAASAATPAADAPSASDALPASDAPAASDAAAAGSVADAPTLSDVAPTTPPATSPAAAHTAPHPAKRKPAATSTAPSASQDAIETEKIITRELGGASPPQTR